MGGLLAAGERANRTASIFVLPGFPVPRSLYVKRSGHVRLSHLPPHQQVEPHLGFLVLLLRDLALQAVGFKLKQFFL